MNVNSARSCHRVFKFSIRFEPDDEERLVVAMPGFEVAIEILTSQAKLEI
jgi:hypothetical protein